jgi:hypothetical protein
VGCAKNYGMEIRRREISPVMQSGIQARRRVVKRAHEVSGALGAARQVGAARRDGDTEAGAPIRGHARRQARQDQAGATKLSESRYAGRETNSAVRPVKVDQACRHCEAKRDKALAARHGKACRKANASR